MTVQEYVQAKLQERGIAEDLQTVLREHGVLDLRLLEKDDEPGSRLADPIELLVELEPNRTLGDMVSLEGDLELLLGHRVSLQTKKSLLIRKLNKLIEESVPING